MRIATEGDRRLDCPLLEMGGKGVFVKELEAALLDGRADMAVHSLKDMPAELPPGLTLEAFPEREDPRDVLVLPRGRDAAALARPDYGEARTAPQRGTSTTRSLDISTLPHGARFGNSSLRRRAQLLWMRPDVEVAPIRGNVDTRLRKLDAGEFDALLLAAAGLRRLGVADRITVALPPQEFVPAPGQGALALECHQDSPWRELIGQLDCPATRTCVLAERDVMARLGGGCLTPLGAYARLRGDTIELFAMLALPDGALRVREHLSGPASGAAELAAALAERIRQNDGDAVLAALGLGS